MAGLWNQLAFHPNLQSQRIPTTGVFSCRRKRGRNRKNKKTPWRCLASSGWGAGGRFLFGLRHPSESFRFGGGGTNAIAIHAGGERGAVQIRETGCRMLEQAPFVEPPKT